MAGVPDAGRQSMKRSPLKRRKRLNPVSRKTRTERWPRLRALRAHVLNRAQGKCEACERPLPEQLLEIHHVKKRSQGGQDIPQNAIALCAGSTGCHARTDFPYKLGRLCITPYGAEQFYCAVYWTKQ